MRKIVIVISSIIVITMFSCIFPIKISLAEPPGDPYNPTPENNSTNVSINIELRWNCEDPDNDTLRYDLFFGNTSSPSVLHEDIPDPNYSPDPLAYNTLYYWRIVAKDENSSTSGPLWKFTTMMQPNRPPAIPSNPNPSDGSIGISVDAVVSWTCSDPDEDTLTYDVYFSSSSPPGKIVSNQSNQSYDTPGNLSYGTTYYWKIVAWDNNGESNVSPVWHFQTNQQSNQPPNTPSSPDPSDGYLGASIDVNISWTGGDPDGDPVSYTVYFGLSNPPPKIVDNQSDTFYDPGTLQYITTYYWKIVAWDPLNESSSGLVWDFMTQSETNQPPNIPSSPLPGNGSLGVSINADISWVGGDLDPGDTVTYDVYMGTSSSPPKRVTNQTTTSYDFGTMSYSTTYYWRIIAWDAQQNSTASPLFHFKTTAQSGGGGEEPPQPPQNIKPIADASAKEPYQGFIDSIILFDGSLSYDPDGNITSWSWEFGDHTHANGVTVYHSFATAGSYTLSLTVTDDSGATNTDTTTCVIRQTNRPPVKPVIQGPTSGTKNTMYTYTVASTDPDNDLLQYTFQWAGSISQSSGFISSGMNYSVNHNWNTAGRYNLTVTVTDNHTESSSKITIYIDTVQTRGAGYLLDNDGDGLYDAFYSDETHQTIPTQRNGDRYLIDKDGDGQWDYVYSAINGLTSYEAPRKTPGFELVIILLAIAVGVIIGRIKRSG